MESHEGASPSPRSPDPTKEAPAASAESPSPAADPPTLPLESPEALEARLRAMAASQDPTQLQNLARILGDPSVLERLDPPVEGYRPMGRLLAVFDVLIAHPSPHTEALGQALLRDEDFAFVPQRLPPVYRTLAAVVPTSEANAAIFRVAVGQGLHQTLAPNLAANASPRALEVLAEILRDPSLTVDDRIEVAHRALLPHRTTPALLERCQAVLDAGTEPQVELAILEALFDHQPRRWFGVAATPPVPPEWATLSPKGREILVRIGRTALRRKDLPAELARAIRTTLSEVTP